MKAIKIQVIDLNISNISSLITALKRMDVNTQIIESYEELDSSCDCIILPGVGAFGASVEKIKSNISIELLKDEVKVKKKPFLGICVGMQVLAEKGLEFGTHEGLGWIEGTVEKINAKGIKLFKRK